MKLPILTELETTRDMVDVFKGYNHNLRIGDGEFYDMRNLTSSYYPVLASRNQRGIAHFNANAPSGLLAKDSLCFVDGNYFVINGERVNLSEMFLTPEPKTLISMGAYVIIMPDKVWINTKDLTKFGRIEARFVSSAETSFEICKVDGSPFGAMQQYEPEITDAMKEGKEEIPLWLDTSTKPHSIKQYSLSNGMWTTIPTVYVKISTAGIGDYFEVNDGVTISGVDAITDQLNDLNNTMIIWEKASDYIIVTGILDERFTQDSTRPIVVERKMPEMDFIIESGNRLWGCRYGLALNGEVVNEIYASKLGDFKNWNCFAGVSTDSYAATVGTDGVFTGAITHLGYPIFFKENCMHKVYGNYPANYQIQTTTCRGVQEGSHKSLAIVNEVLYYKSRNSVCMYDGSLPQEISYALGEVSYSDAVACSHGNKYYISMHDDNADRWKLFVYDVAKGMWHLEDNLHANELCSCRGDLYYVEYEEYGKNEQQIKTLNDNGNRPYDESIEWRAETGIISAEYPDKKYISRMNVRMSVSGNVFCEIQYDSTDRWENVFSMYANSRLRTLSVPIRPKRCDHFRLRFSGMGDVKIYSITKTLEQGSDM